MLYPNVSDWWNSFHQTRAIASYVEATEDLSGQQQEEMLEAARAYNESLLTKSSRWLPSEEEVAEYESVLDVSGTGIMGYVQISKINVSLPIYHGTDEAVLQIAIGHLTGSSLPVGGASTHCVLSGHRGLPSAKLFSDLDKLKEGDTFTLTVLNQTVTYEVDQIRIVEPADISNLEIVDGGDYCTLVTCTPYGVNTHRLLVRGHRIENIVGELVVTAEAIRIPRYVVIPAVGIPMVVLLFVGLLIYARRQKPTVESILKAQQELEKKKEADKEKES